MSDSSKKLTVSFGAFSCTLAGFDDPFPIMKQVVDYFQQLAASDPSFGAHPQRPSTEALREIAEAGAGIPVQAEMLGDEIILSQSEPIIETETTHQDTAYAAPAEAEYSDLEEPAAMVLEEPAAIIEPQQPELIDRDELWAAFDGDPVEEVGLDDSAMPSFEPEVDVAQELAIEPDVDLAQELAIEPDVDLAEEPVIEPDVDLVEEPVSEPDVELAQDAVIEPQKSIAEEAAQLCAPLDLSGFEVVTEVEVQAETDVAPEAQYSYHTEPVEQDVELDMDLVAQAVAAWTPPETARPDAENTAQAEEIAAFSVATDAACQDALIAAAEIEPELPEFEDAPEAVLEEPDVSPTEPLVMDAPELQEWEAEFAGPVQQDTSEPEAAVEDDEFHEQEDAALERILSALRARNAEDFPDTYVSADAPADLSAEALAEAPAEAPADVSAEANATDEAPQKSLPPLVLGFGDQAGLDATHDAETDTIDVRQSDEERALDTMIGQANNDMAEFDYVSSEAPAPTPAPLVLTSAQVVQTELVLDNPISDAEGQLQDDAEPADLREFATQVGAASVTDLIEASAAYVTLVSGRPSFSRREVLGMLDELAEDQPLTQETRIKSFGTLLRGGRFKRSDNGEFAMTDDALSQYDDCRSA